MLTRNNYETWFIDYHDGALSKAQEAELFAFLEQNGDLKAEFEFFNSVTLEPELISFSGKDSLKKSLIDRSNYKTWFVSYMENDLSESDRKLVEEFLKANPELHQELELIIKTKSIPDYTIIFENKESLRKSAKVVSFSRTAYRSLSIAASIVLIAVAYYLIQIRGQQKEEFANGQSATKPAVPSVVIPDSSERKFADQTETPVKNSSDVKDNQKKNGSMERRKSNPSTNLAQGNRKPDNPKKIESPKPQQSPAPEPQLANQNPKKNQLPVNLPTTQNTPALANQPAGNAASSRPKPTAAELATVFSADELKELGIQPAAASTNIPPVSIPVLQYAVKEVKTISDKSEITLKKDQNIVTDATTYALNIGKGFSVSHTSVK